MESSFIAVKSLDVVQSAWRLENSMTYLRGFLAGSSLDVCLNGAAPLNEWLSSLVHSH